MTFQCPRCQERVKHWEGDDPKCGFDGNGNFLVNNWNCATLNALRERAEENAVWSDNQQNVSVIQTYEVGHAILSWYKQRGQTEDFRDGYFDRGTLKYAQQILGDIEPDDNGWDDYLDGEDEE